LEEERQRLQHVHEGFDDEHLHDESEDDSTGELSHLDQHAADVGSETFEREKEFSILEEVEAEMADVERALRRLEEGTYGRCEVCRQAIAEERLEVLPAARFCLTHQSEAEHRRAAWPETETTR
jgi:RNA polymerase-binding transcription factor DksA